jgi:hypothetical protein
MGQESSKSTTIISKARERIRKVLTTVAGPLHDLFATLARETVFQMAVENLSVIDVMALAQTSKEHADLLLAAAYFRAAAHQHFRSPFPPHNPLQLLTHFDAIFASYAWTEEDHPVLVSNNLAQAALEYWQNAYAGCSAYVRYALAAIAWEAHETFLFTISKQGMVKLEKQLTAVAPDITASGRVRVNYRRREWFRDLLFTIMDNSWVAATFPAGQERHNLRPYLTIEQLNTFYTLPRKSAFQAWDLPIALLDAEDVVQFDFMGPLELDKAHDCFTFRSDPAKRPAIRIKELHASLASAIGIHVPIQIGVAVTALDVDVIVATLTAAGRLKQFHSPTETMPVPHWTHVNSDMTHLWFAKETWTLGSGLLPLKLLIRLAQGDMRGYDLRTLANVIAFHPAKFGVRDGKPKYVLFQGLAAARCPCDNCPDMPATSVWIHQSDAPVFTCPTCRDAFRVANT